MPPSCCPSSFALRVWVELAGELCQAWGLLGEVCNPLTWPLQEPRSGRCPDQAYLRTSTGLGGTGEVFLLPVGLVAACREAAHLVSFSTKSASFSSKQAWGSKKDFLA